MPRWIANVPVQRITMNLPRRATDSIRPSCERAASRPISRRDEARGELRPRRYVAR